MPDYITQAAEKLDFKVDNVVSSSEWGYNATVTPTGSIMVGESLLSNSSPKEIDLRFAHEIAHIQKNHMLKKESFPFCVYSSASSM